MRFRGHGNGLAISIATLALVLAGTGAAVATTATTTVSDPKDPSRVARVDTAGRLTTVGVTNTVSTQAYFSNAGVVNLTSPTTASLAITQLALSETAQNAGIAGSDLTVRFVQNSVDANGSCTTTPTRYIAITALSAGDHVDLASAAPFVVPKPAGSAKYCLGIYSVVTNGATDATSYYPYVTFGAYVVSGTYTGIGTSSTPDVTSGVAALPDKTR